MVLSVQDVKSVMVGPGAARFKVHHKSVTHTNSRSNFAFRAQAEIHFNPQLLSAKYLAAHDNLARVSETCKKVKTEQDAKVFARRQSTMMEPDLKMASLRDRISLSDMESSYSRRSRLRSTASSMKLPPLSRSSVTSTSRCCSPSNEQTDLCFLISEPPLQHSSSPLLY